MRACITPTHPTSCPPTAQLASSPESPDPREEGRVRALLLFPPDGVIEFIITNESAHFPPGGLPEALFTGHTASRHLLRRDIGPRGARKINGENSDLLYTAVNRKHRVCESVDPGFDMFVKFYRE